MKFSYPIEGMHCESCIEKIRQALSPHLKVLDVSLNPPLLVVEADQAPDIATLNAYLATAGKYQLKTTTSTAPLQPELKNYFPLILIASYILGVALINHLTAFNWHGFMNQFMAGFFLVFSAFKLLDIHGFAEGYASYDLLAKRWHFYGYIYPFLELGLGILYLTEAFPVATQYATILIMGFSSLGMILFNTDENIIGFTWRYTKITDRVGPYIISFSLYHL